MKVICIDGLKPGDKVTGNLFYHTVENGDEIIEGEEYDTISAEIVRGVPIYRLRGKKYNSCYRQIRFAPLSDIDETEMERNYNVVKALFP